MQSILEFQRNTVQLSRNTISIPRNPESPLVRDNREYVEFLSSMFVVGVHRSGRRARDDAMRRARWGPTDPFSRNAPEYAHDRIQPSFCESLAYIRAFTKVQVAYRTMAASVVVAETIADPETFSTWNARSLIQLWQFDVYRIFRSFSLSLSLLAHVCVFASDK